MSATIKVFHVGEKCFSHVMNADRDEVELRDEGNQTLLIYGPDAKVSNESGHMGNFHVEFIDGQPCWVYYEELNQTRTVFGPDLLSAEVEVSRRFIDDSWLSATST